jgi:MOSC domain-containing protein YiiM
MIYFAGFLLQPENLNINHMEIFPEEKPYEAFFNNFIREGEIIWIGIREKVHEPMTVLEETHANIGGLTGDRANKGNPESKRQVTLIQY